MLKVSVKNKLTYFDDRVDGFRMKSCPKSQKLAFTTDGTALGAILVNT